MLIFIIRMVYLIVCAGTIAAYVSQGPFRPEIVATHPLATFVVLMLVTMSVMVFDIIIPRKRLEVISGVYFGLLIGVLLSYIFTLALGPILHATDFNLGINMLIFLMIPYLCTSLLLQTKDDFRFIIPYVEFARELKGGRPMVMDSSALIDGRIGDVIETKIIDSEIIVPDFILAEVQDIADSNDKMRRSRGRRGLDVLSKMQNSAHADVKMYDSGKEEKANLSVDQRLVELAKKLGGRVVTNDFNLNKVASVQGVDVINLNDVANSLKPRYLPGERLRIKIIKEGESPGQGVGYLDDGTMVVCEQGSQLLGKETYCIVTSVLQSSAGRMIFAKVQESPYRSGTNEQT